ncbi:MAG: threonine/serine dehydratase [Xanthomonadales bacterium]|nr:threonine/serine dehydratase [Xanthomonadales bacterium]
MTDARRDSIQEITQALLLAAQKRLSQVISTVPLLQNTPLDQIFDCQLFIQCENLQPTGSFKYRGASNAILGMLESAQLNTSVNSGVCTHSSGNHGRALARAARLNGLSADIVVPHNAVTSKLEAMRAEGANIHLCEPTQTAREAGLQALVEKGLIAIPPYDHPLVIAGQGTWALEILNQVENLDMLLIPVGGGGLAAGTILARNLMQQAQTKTPLVIGAEPKQADDCWRSLQQGQRVKKHYPDTVADGLRALVGKLTFPIIQAGITDVLRVTEAGIKAARALATVHLGQAIEPSSATVLAAIDEYPEVFSGRKVGLILTGGNIADE